MVQQIIKRPPIEENVLLQNARKGIMRAKPNSASAEGGNRTLIPVGNTILSRARLPIPPLRLLNLRSQVYHSQF